MGENVLYATLSERESVASSLYVMKLTPTENKKNPITLKPIDVTVAGDRVNKIKITLVPSVAQQNLPQSLVFLEGGDYIYEIFNDVGQLLEKGMLQYNTTVPQTQYSNNVTEKVYHG